MSNVPKFTLIEPQDWYLKNNKDVAYTARRAAGYLKKSRIGTC